MRATIIQNGPIVLTILLAGAYTAGGFSMIIGYATGSSDWEPNVLEVVFLGAIPIVAGPMILWGLYISKRSQRLGPGLVAVGTVAVTAAWFWLLIFLVPASIVVIAFSVFRARESVRERNPSLADVTNQ